MLDELWHAFLAVAALTVLICLIWINLTDLPLAPLLFGEAIGAPTGIVLLALTSPRRR
ncbi:MAG TPA: hypothetical protein VFA70_04615 [Dehalococcoidia bacterium]|nr:hypothetical protein [Dehalococcoidia bacterium]